MESVGKGLEETRYVVQNARSGFTNKCSGIWNRLELFVGFQCTNCIQGAVVRTVGEVKFS